MKRLNHTSLFEIHQESGGRMVPFAGWEMPVQYSGALPEHRAVRRTAGLFDVSHMGEIEIRGRDALHALQRLTCNDVEKIVDGQAQYSAFLTPRGTFIDDIVLYRIHREHFLICVNAANKDKDFAWVREHLTGRSRASDVSSRFAQLALQGPASQSILQPLTALDLAEIRYYRFAQGEVAGVTALVSRTGYTGEDGFELYLAPQDAPGVWKALMEEGTPQGLIPAGLAARNTLRLEVCYPLYGNDIDDSTTPLEAGLGWIAKLDRDDFIGRDALLAQKLSGPSRKLAAFEVIDRGIARDGYGIDLEGRPASRVTSGGYGPTVEKSIGMTYLPTEADRPGAEIGIDVRGKRLRASIVKKPFYKRS